MLHLIDATTGAVIRTSLFETDSSSDIAKRWASELTEVVNSASRNLPDSDGSSLTVNGDVNSAGGTDSAEARSYYERGKEL